MDGLHFPTADVYQALSIRPQLLLRLCAEVPTIILPVTAGTNNKQTAMLLFGRTAARIRMHRFLQLQLHRQSMTWVRLLNYPLHILRGRETLEHDETITVVMVMVAAGDCCCYSLRRRPRACAAYSSAPVSIRIMYKLNK